MSIDTGIFKADDLAYLTAARQNEQDHYDALAKVLGAHAPKNLTFTYPMGTFDSDKSIADTGTALETAFVGAYMGAIPALVDNGLKEVAAQIGANEAQHLTTFKSLAAGGTLVPNPSFPKALTRGRGHRGGHPVPGLGPLNAGGRLTSRTTRPRRRGSGRAGARGPGTPGRP